MSTFNSQVYRDSAHNRLNAALGLLKAHHFIEAIYLSGVAVECMFLSFIRTESKHYDGKHSLDRLLTESGMADYVTCNRGYFHGLVTSVFRRWNNDLRYISISELRKRYNLLGLNRYNNQKKIKGDFVEFNAKEAFNTASLIIKEGEFAWLKKMNEKLRKT